MDVRTRLQVSGNLYPFPYSKDINKIHVYIYYGNMDILRFHDMKNFGISLCYNSL